MVSSEIHKMRYSKKKCICLRGKKIVGMGKPTDKHLECHKCKGPLFPWERYLSVCMACKEVIIFKESIKAHLNPTSYLFKRIFNWFK